MGIGRRITRLATRRRTRGADAPMEDLDRRAYDRPWRRFDRRAVAPALMGAAMMFPGRVEAQPPGSGRAAPGGEQPERQRRDRSPLHGLRLVGADAGPGAAWFGDWNADVALDVGRRMDGAAGQGAVPVLVAYNIPNRGCDPHGDSGADGAQAYRDWIRDLARGIGDGKAVVILEPDALGLVSCLSHQARSQRFSLLREAVRVLTARTNARVYVDAGHAEWVDAEEMAQRLHLAGVDRAHGFALNVGHVVPIERNLSYGEQLSRRLDGARFVIDVASLPGADAGSIAVPRTDTGHPLVDAFLRVKEA